MKIRPQPNHDGKDPDRRARRMTTALWFCLFALFAAASSESEEEEKASEEVAGAGWFGGPDTVVENPGKAKSADVAESGSPSRNKLADLLNTTIPDNGSDKENLEALHTRVKAIEAEGFKLSEAAKSADSVEKLSLARADLGEALKLLESSEGHEPGKYAAKLRESLGAKREEFSSKFATINKPRAKESYLKLLSELKAQMEKLDGIDRDLAAVLKQVEALAIDAAIEEYKNELNAVEREGLGDKEAQAVLAELKADIEGDLDELYHKKKNLEARDPGSESAAPYAQPKTVTAKPTDVTGSGSPSRIKLADILNTTIPDNGSDKENLEALRIRVKAIEAEVFKGVMEAAESADPVEKLSLARADLGEASKLLESSEGHEPGKYAVKLRESIGAKREEISSKVATTDDARSKNNYVKMLSTLDSSVEKLDGIDEDLIAVSSLTKQLEGELKEMMEVYTYMKGISGETAAKAELLEALSEKQKEWLPDQSEEL